LVWLSPRRINTGAAFLLKSYMKKIFVLMALVFATASAFAVRLEYLQDVHVTPPASGATNVLRTIDLTGASGFSASISFTGQGANKTTGLIGVTNTAGGTNGQTFTLTLGGTATTYTWTNSVTTNASVFSNQASLLRIGLTNTPTNGQTLTLTINGTANIYTWTNTAQAGSTTFVTTNSTTGTSATNLYQFLISQPIIGDLFTVTQYATNGIQIVGRALDTLSITNSDGWGTNLNSTVYLTTNSVATNSHQVLVATNTASAATNLYTKILADYSGSTPTNSLILSYYATNGVQLVTPYDAAFTISTPAGWATNQVTINAIAGGLNFVASNSPNGSLWFADPSRNFSVAFNSTAAVTARTNFSSLPEYGYWTYGIENATTNYAYPSGWNLIIGIKNGK
jgi:hypothetical protein